VSIPAAATSQNKYTFTLELADLELTKILHREPLQAVSRLVEHFIFEVRCRGLIDDGAEDPPSEVIPVWSGGSEGPFVNGIRVRLDFNGDKDAVVKDFGITHFASQARTVASNLIVRGVLKQDERFHYLISALRSDVQTETSGQEPKRGFHTSVRTPRIAFLPTPLASLSSTLATDEAQEKFLDVLIPRVVADEILGRVEQSNEDELGGFLIGNLCRDPSSGRAFVLVNAQVEAREGTEATCTSFKFTDRTFLAASHCLQSRRRKGERIVGWYHSHVFCRKCEKRNTCDVGTVFWSQSDQTVHESAFPHPYQFGLVVGYGGGAKNTGNGPYAFKLYGWRDCMITERPVTIVNGVDDGEAE